MAALIDLDANSIAGANGSAVATFPDVSGNGLDFVQATGADQPTLVTSAVNGLNAVRFNGSFMRNAATGLSGQTSITIFAVMAVDAISTPTRSGVLSAVSAGLPDDYYTASGNWAIGHPANTGETVWESLTCSGGVVAPNDSTILASSRALGEFAIVAISLGVDGADIEVYVNGAAETPVTGATGGSTVTLDDITMGARVYGGSASTDRAQFTIARLQIHPSRLSTTDRDTVTSSLGATYGITVAGGADSGALAGVTGAPSGALTGDVSDSGVLAGVTPAPSGDLVASVTVAGALAGTTPAPTGTLYSTAPIEGALAGITPAPSGALVATVTLTGVLAGVTPAPSGTLTDGAATVYPLHAGTVIDGVGRLAGGTVVDHVDRLHAGSAS